MEYYDLKFKVVTCTQSLVIQICDLSRDIKIFKIGFILVSYLLEGENMVLIIELKIQWWRVWVRNPNIFFPLYLRPASLIEGEEFFFLSENIYLPSKGMLRCFVQSGRVFNAKTHILMKWWVSYTIPIYIYMYIYNWNCFVSRQILPYTWILFIMFLVLFMYWTEIVLFCWLMCWIKSNFINWGFGFVCWIFIFV